MATHTIGSCENSSPVITSAADSSAIASLTAAEASTSRTASAVIDDDCFEDGCSICLEPFSSGDPPTVTSCKHEYHLQCILEWSQRSKECPICWQLFVLKDPARQELLAAVENERMMRSRSKTRLVYQERDVNNDVSLIDESEFEERILRHFASAKSMAHLVNRRRRQSSLGLGPSQEVSSVSVENNSSLPQTNDFPEENKILSYGVEVGLPASVPPASSMEPRLSPDRIDGPAKHGIFLGQTSPDGHQKSSPSEFLAFSESVKAKFSAASAKYKESFSKSTRGFKEKLLAKNCSVKELSKGVQREMSASFAGVARMIERLDLSSKRTGDTVPLSSYLVETSDLTSRGKEVDQSATARPLATFSGETTHDKGSGILPSTSLLYQGK